MSGLAEHAAVIALARAGALPWREYADLLEEAGSAARLLSSPGIRTNVAQGSLLDDTRSAPDTAAAEAALAAWRSAGIQLVTVLDPGYPPNLLAAHDRPPFIFVSGRLLPEADARSVAVIGARDASARGRRTSATLAEHLAEHRFVVVSGLARGIDTAAHEAALAAGGRTIAVLGNGLRHAYPPQNAELQQRIAATGALVSQFWPDTPPSRETFPLRNAVMSGVALATVIVEASFRSGARIQARLALAQGRPLVLWHELLAQGWARSLAQRPGVHVADSPDQATAIVERLTAHESLVE